MTTWSIRPAERPLAATLAAYYFLIVAALYLIKPARNALFLEGLGADSLPWGFIVTAFISSVVIVLYTWQAGRTRLLSLMQTTLGAAVLCLVGFWMWLSPAQSAMLLIFYVWVKLYGLLLPSQFWLLSEELMDPRQARRLFIPIGAGGILGGIVGSSAAGLLALVFGTRLLMLVAAIVVLGAWILFRRIVALAPIDRKHPTGQTSHFDDDAAATAAGESTSGTSRDDPTSSAPPPSLSLIVSIAGVLMLLTVVHTIVDWQFNKAAELSIASTDGRAAFFGLFFAIAGLLTLAVQLLVTGFMLRFFGIGMALALLPVALATGAFGILLYPALLSTTLARGADDALRYSVDQSARELLFLPIASAERRRWKPFIDVIGRNTASGIGGTVILAVIWMVSDPSASDGSFAVVRVLSLVSLVVLTAWGLMVVRARRQYADTLQHLLRVRDLDVTQLAQSRLDADAHEAIREGLSSTDHDTVQVALGLAANTAPEAFVEELRALLRTSEDAELKAQTLHLLTEARDESALAEALANIDQADRELTAEALAYACATGDPEAIRRIDAYLAGDDPLLAAAAAVCLLEHSDPDQQAEGVKILQRAATIDTSHTVELRVTVADIIRRQPEIVELKPVLEDLLGDEAPQVIRAALAAAANHRDGDLVPAICEAGLQRTVQNAAIQALQVMEAESAGPLTGILADPRNRRSKRCFAARAMGRLGGSAAAEGLMAGLVADDRRVRSAALKALNYMRRRGERLHLGRRREAAAIQIEWRDYLSLHRLAAGLGAPGTDSPTAFVATVVSERLREAEERLFRALALRHPIQAVFFAYRGLITQDAAARANAIELVDSIIETPERRILVRLLEANAHAACGRIAAAELDRDVPSTDAALRELLDPGDPWLAACAVRALGPDNADLAKGVRQDLLAHGYPPLSELLSSDV